MGVSEQDWGQLRDTWEGYRDAVEGWLQTAAEPGADAGEVDALIHRVIDAHNQWSDGLGAMIQSTHHH